MSSELVVAAVVVFAILAVIVVARIFSTQRTRQRNEAEQGSQRLRLRFGGEYDRTLAETGDVRVAESDLRARQKRVESFHIRPLGADESKNFSAEWQAIQAGFVDNPSTAVHDADALIGQVMAARGYPEGDYEQRLADVSVDHPAVLERYRTVHEIALRDANAQADTEDLRQAILHSHALFTEMLDEQPAVETVQEAPVPVATR